MSRSFISTAPGTSADYQKYFYDAPVKDDRDSDAILLDFSLVAADASFVRLSRGNYIKYTTDTYGVWYTGYITNEPEYTYLGARNNSPAWGYRYQVSSDEIILSQNALGIFAPFLNQTQGAILQALANQLQPGLFDFSNVQPGLTLARYVVDPTKKFSDVAKSFCDASVYRCYAKDHKLYYAPSQGAVTSLVIDGTDPHFTPGNLVVKASIDAAICNDCLVLGNIEPQRYTAEYFVGDGFTGEYALSSNVFGVESALLLDDSFGGGTFDTSKWTVYDQPTNYIQLFNGYVNVVGGLADNSYAVHLDSANLLTLGGSWRIAHGEYDFVPQTTDNVVCGVIGGLWTQAPNSSFTGCVYGLKVTKTAGVVTLNPIVNGVVDAFHSQVVQTNGATANVPLWSAVPSYVRGQVVSYLGVVYVCLATTAPGDLPTDVSFWAQNVAKRYVIRTIVSSSVLYRATAEYRLRISTGGTTTFGGGTVPAALNLHTYITELDPNTGAITPGYPKVFASAFFASASQVFSYYIPVASNDLHVTFTGLTISTPIQAELSTVEDGPGAFINKLVGPNEIDATDGLAPFATIAQQGGVNARQNILGTPQYAFGSPKLEFFKDTAALTTTVPQQGDIVRLTYRSAGAAMGRSRDQRSVNLESANWGDSGVRSVVRTNGVTPQPQTSEDCEAAAAAIVSENSYTHYEGTYEVIAQNCASEPLAGQNLQFLNLPLSAFPVTNFNEPISEVVTHFMATSQGEQFVHNITYGLKGDSQRLRKTLAGFQLQSDVFVQVDTAQTPLWVPPSTLAMAYAPEVVAPGLDFTNNGTYAAWAATHVYTLGTIILDPNNNRQLVVVAGTSGGTIPTFAAFINTAGQVGATFTIAQVQITSGVITITATSSLSGIVNVGAKIALTGVMVLAAINGMTLTSSGVSGLTFTAAINHADYSIAGETGTGTVTAVGTVRPITADGGTLKWQLVGHSYGVDATHIYFDAGQSPTSLGVIPAGGGYGTDGYGLDPYGTDRSGIPGVGFEVRYTDDSWGCDGGKNLAGRFTTQRFSLARNQRNGVVFIRSYDGRNILLSSENWLTSAALTFSKWLGPTVTQTYGVDPDGDISYLNQVTLVGGSPLTSTTPAQTYVVGTRCTFTVSVKGVAGALISLGINCATPSNGSTVTAGITMTGQWQRLSVSMVTTGAATETIVASLAAATTPITIIGTRASVEMGTDAETIYCKTQDTPLTGLGSVYGANSRYGGSVRIGYPLVPPTPSGFVDVTDIANPVVNVLLPAVAQDVWGIEVRAADDATVLYSANLTDAGYAPAYTVANNAVRALNFHLYTYNLLGEYSAGFNVLYTIPVPTITSVTVDDATKTLAWTSNNASSYSIEIDDTSSAITHVVSHVVRPIIPRLPRITATSEVLSDPDFFYQRWFRIIPYDAIGVGTSTTVSHVYTPTAVVQFNGNEVKAVAPPSTPVTDPVIPTWGTGYNPIEYIHQSWSDYKTNRER